MNVLDCYGHWMTTLGFPFSIGENIVPGDALDVILHWPEKGDRSKTPSLDFLMFFFFSLIFVVPRAG